MKDFNDFKVKDITLADFGRQEILLAQDEMPAMMQLREKYREEQPLGEQNNGMHPHDDSDSCLN